MTVSEAQKETRALTILQVIALILVQGTLGVAVYRQFGSSVPIRNNRIALGFAAKSTIILFYELLTEHVQRLARFGSLKAYMILGIIEVVFWIAVPVLMVMAWIKDDWKGITAILGGVIVGLGSIIALLCIPLAFISFKRWKRSKAIAQTITGDTNPVEVKGACP